MMDKEKPPLKDIPFPKSTEQDGDGTTVKTFYPSTAITLKEYLKALRRKTIQAQYELCGGKL
jgi:hypothetical protein